MTVRVTYLSTFSLSPLKLNYALRKVVRVRLTYRFEITTYILGIDNTLLEHSLGLVRRGRDKDLSGVRYYIVQITPNAVKIRDRQQGHSSAL